MRLLSFSWERTMYSLRPAALFEWSVLCPFEEELDTVSALEPAASWGTLR